MNSSPELRARALIHHMWDELEKIANEGMPAETAEAMQAPQEEAPVQEVFGAQVLPIDKRKAHGTPILPPPPGYVYDAELQQFAPDPQTAGWITEAQAAVAESNQAHYAKGQQDAVQQSAQQQVDQQVEQQMQQAQMQQQDTAQQEQAQNMELQRQQLDLQKKQVKQAVNPASGAGASTKPQAPRKPAADAAKKGPDGKAVTINLGR